MLRFLIGAMICLVACPLVIRADTPGEEAVKTAITWLKEKRAVVKDKADQALLDTAIKDLEERLAQVSKGEPEPEEKKAEAFVMPKGWELKFNTGKSRPSYNPKTGELKLVYDFSDAKQLKDFEYDKDAAVKVEKGTFVIKGGDSATHAVNWTTLTVTGEILIGHNGHPLRSSSGYYLGFGANGPHSLYVGFKGLRDDIASHGLQTRPISSGQFYPVKKWFVTSQKVGFLNDEIDISGKNTPEKSFGKLVFEAEKAPNGYRKLTLAGTLDPEWAKEFFADKK